MSFFKWDILGTHTFTGLRNYKNLLTDPTFYKSMFNTFVLWAATTIPQIVICIVLAVLLNAAYVKGRNAFRLAIFVPNITSVMAVALVFTVVFGNKYGLVNQILQLLGADPVKWKGTSGGSLTALSFMINWRWIGQGVIIFLAALQGIPECYYEAADLDGASVFQKFIHITVPMLKQIIIFKLIISTINGLNIFIEPMIFCGPGGGGSQEGLTMTLYMYEEAFGRNNFGYASSISCMMLIIVGIAVAMNVFASSKLKGED